MSLSKQGQKRFKVAKVPCAEHPRVALVNEDIFALHVPINEVVVHKLAKPFLPVPEFLIQGLEPDSEYVLCICMESVDGLRYTHDGKEWVALEKHEEYPNSVSEEVYHPDDIRTGAYWMGKIILFDNLQITPNWNERSPNCTYVQTYRKYKPLLSILKVIDECTVVDVGCFTFPHTEFIPVSSLKNPVIRGLRPPSTW